MTAPGYTMKQRWSETVSTRIVGVGEMLADKAKVVFKVNTGAAVLGLGYIIGLVAAVAGIAYAVYRFFTPDYLEDFEDDFDDDFDDDFQNHHTALTSAIVTTVEFKQQKNNNSIQYQEHFLTEYSSTLTTYTHNAFSVSTW